MKFNKKEFSKNIMFFIVSTSIVVVFVVLSFFIGNNTASENVEELPEAYENEISKLVINEIQTSNNGNTAAPDGGVYDWIELYNGTDKDKDLTNYSLSDNNNEIKWAFPTDTIIKAGEYLVVYLSGVNQDGLYANFRLKAAGGEKIALRSSSKKIVDMVETLPMEKGNVMARQKDGSFVVYNKCTPGYNNDLDGYANYIKSITKVDEDGLVINEFLPRNDGNFKNELDIYSGYIEIKNTGNKTVNLKSYSISNDLGRPFKYQLPDVNLDEGEIFLIYTSNTTDNSKNYNATFKLENKTGDVVLSKGSNIIDSYSYENLSDGIGYVKEKDKFIKTSDITPGFENNNVEGFRKKYQETESTLIISEVMNNNYSYLEQNGGKYYDLIELYNNSGKEIKLSDYCISKTNDGCTAKLPDVTLKAKEYYVVMASGNSNLSNDKYFHVNFKIGDTTGLYLYKEDKIEHALFVNNVPNGYSIGVSLSNGVFYYDKPTPLAANNGGVAWIAAAPFFNKEGGVYNDVDKLSIELYGEGTIYYTKDGSIPTTSSSVYKEPIEITKTTVIKTMSTNANKKSSKMATESYIVNENHTIDVLSLTIDPSALREINGNAWVEDVERLAYAEFYGTDNTSFDIPCGLMLFGGSTRGHTRKSYSINFRKKYGEGTLEFPVFDSRESSTYESLVLRTSSQDERHSFLRDIVGTVAVDGLTEVEVQAYRPVAMYINGSYWGFYWIREKVNEDFVSNHFNTDVSNDVNIMRIDWDVKAGNSSSYSSLLSYIGSNDMTTDKAYKYVKSKMNITSFMDFYLSELFTTNNDIVNTRLFNSSKIDDGRWHYIFYDLDVAFYNMEKDYLYWMTTEGGMGGRFNNTFIRGLLRNKTFQDEFLKRANYMLTKVWNKERTTKILDDLLEKYSDEIIRSHKEWGFDVDNWKQEVKDLRYYLENRQKPMLKNLKSYFKLSDKQMKEYYGDLYE